MTGNIFQTLADIFSSPEYRYMWLTSFNHDLGAVPLDLMVGSEAGYNKVRDYLKSARERGA
jgi:hypothetical protein